MHLKEDWPIAGALVWLVALLATATGCAATPLSRQPTLTHSTPSPSAPCSTGAGSLTSQCGVSFEELRRLNLRYADRDPFSGDGRGILKDEARVRGALKVLAKPTVVTVRAALVGSGFSADSIGTSTNAVRMAGVAFAVEADGGCIFGAIYAGELTVDVGGYINDGGCLAAYGH